MSFQRGDVVLATLPFVTRPGSKRRPALVIQNDASNARMQNTIVAFITTNLARAHLPTQVLVEVKAAAGRQSGFIADSVVTCENLITIRQSQARKIGSLPPDVMHQIDAALKASLALP
ncbi:MAG: type II toxin-antitoxin system PemK/MazF family toxin [Planctomycetes bacterium]|nr:type II toxin-antitoxin system PemK/MazF family toxin [Planctomycetota bacterium]